jgi:hypothetical protein
MIADKDSSFREGKLRQFKELAESYRQRENPGLVSSIEESIQWFEELRRQDPLSVCFIYLLKILICITDPVE